MDLPETIEQFPVTLFPESFALFHVKGTSHFRHQSGAMGMVGEIDEFDGSQVTRISSREKRKRTR